MTDQTIGLTMISAREHVRRLWRVLGPVVTIVALLAAWEIWVVAAEIKPFILPTPSAIVDSFLERPAFYLSLGINTLREALTGLVIGSVFGAVTALVVFRGRTASRITEIVSAGLLAVPMVALVPLANVFLGLTPSARITVVSIAVYPIAVSFLLTGLRHTDQGLVLVFRSLALSRGRTAWSLYLPAMVPAAMSALRVALPTAFSIAIVAEFFGGERNTLGTFIKSTAVQSNVADMWSAAMVAFIFALVLYIGLTLIDRRLTRWHSARS